MWKMIYSGRTTYQCQETVTFHCLCACDSIHSFFALYSAASSLCFQSDTKLQTIWHYINWCITAMLRGMDWEKLTPAIAMTRSHCSWKLFDTQMQPHQLEQPRQVCSQTRKTNTFQSNRNNLRNYRSKWSNSMNAMPTKIGCSDCIEIQVNSERNYDETLLRNDCAWFLRSSFQKSSRTNVAHEHDKCATVAIFRIKCNWFALRLPWL